MTYCKLLATVICMPKKKIKADAATKAFLKKIASVGGSAGSKEDKKKAGSKGGLRRWELERKKQSEEKKKKSLDG